MKFNKGASAREYGRRGARVHRETMRHNVEGEQVTSTDIGLRIGRSTKTANKRLNREIAKAGPVTWAGLMEP